MTALKTVAGSVLGVVLFAVPAFAVEVVEATETSASPQKVWSTISDFCSIADWHPAVKSCKTSEADGKTRRTLELVGGGTLVEELVNRDDNEKAYTYRIVSGPLPVSNYEAKISVAGNDNKTTISWDGTFDAADGKSDDQAAAIIRGIYVAGLDGIAGKVSGK